MSQLYIKKGRKYIPVPEFETGTAKAGVWIVHNHQGRGGFWAGYLTDFVDIPISGSLLRHVPGVAKASFDTARTGQTSMHDLAEVALKRLAELIQKEDQ